MPTTWEPGSVASVTLSSGNTVATNTGTTATNQGAHGLTADGRTSGKYYFEITLNNVTGGANLGCGIGTTVSTYTNMGNSATVGVEIYNSQNIYANGVNTGVNLGSSLGVGLFLFGVAVDLDNRRMWYRSGAAGNWNNNATYNPAANTGGVTIPAGTMVPFCNFGGAGCGAGNSWGGNFGATAFSGVVPSGFIAGFPTASGGGGTQAIRVMVMA